VKAPDVSKSSDLVKVPEAERIMVLPEAKEPRRWGLISGVALAVVAALAVGVVAGYAWQDRAIADRDDALREARATLGQARADLEVAATREAGLVGDIGDLREQLGSVREGRALIRATRADERRRAERLQQILAGTRGQLRELTGPALRPGIHLGYVVGASAGDGLLVLDPARRLTGSAADRAATTDGVAPRGPYVRNLDTTWSILRVAPGTAVSLRGYRGGPATITFDRFEVILSSSRAADERVAQNPFWVTIQDRQVVAIVEQRYR